MAAHTSRHVLWLVQRRVGEVVIIESYHPVQGIEFAERRKRRTKPEEERRAESGHRGLDDDDQVKYKVSAAQHLWGSTLATWPSEHSSVESHERF